MGIAGTGAGRWAARAGRFSGFRRSAGGRHGKEAGGGVAGDSAASGQAPAGAEADLAGAGGERGAAGGGGGAAGGGGGGGECGISAGLGEGVGGLAAGDFDFGAARQRVLNASGQIGEVEVSEIRERSEGANIVNICIRNI